MQEENNKTVFNFSYKLRGKAAKESKWKIKYPKTDGLCVINFSKGKILNDFKILN